MKGAIKPYQSRAYLAENLKYLKRSGQISGDLTIENYKTITNNNPQLLENGNYSYQLKKFIDEFEFDNLHIIIKDDIDNKPVEVLNNLYDFLEVKSDFIPSIVKKKVSTSINPKIKLFEKVRIKLHVLSKKYAPWFINFIKKYRISEFYRKLNNKKGFKIEKEVKEILYKYYEEEINETEKLIKRDLSIWKK